MEENKAGQDQDPQTDISPTGRIIDVQVPADEPEQSIIPTVEAAGDAPENKELSEDTIASAPSAPEESADTVSEEPSKEAHSEEVAPTHAEKQPATAHKTGAPIVTIITAVIVATGLIAVTVYAYMKSQDTSKTDKYSLPSVNSQQPAVDTTSQEVDEASKEVDDSLKSVDETDFPESELSDQALGL